MLWNIVKHIDKLRLMESARVEFIPNYSGATIQLCEPVPHCVKQKVKMCLLIRGPYSNMR